MGKFGDVSAKKIIVQGVKSVFSPFFYVLLFLIFACFFYLKQIWKDMVMGK